MDRVQYAESAASISKMTILLPRYAPIVTITDRYCTLCRELRCRCLCTVSTNLENATSAAWVGGASRTRIALEGHLPGTSATEQL